MRRIRRGDGYAATRGAATLTRRRALLAGQLLVTALVTWFILGRVGLSFEQLDGVARSDWLPAPLPLLAASGLLLLAYFLSAAVWGRIVVDLGGPDLGTRESVRLFMIANLGRYLPGKVWQIAGLAALARSRGVPAATGTGAAILGQGVALLAATGVGLAALFESPEPYRTLGVVGAIALGIVVVLCAIPRMFGTLASLWFGLARAEAPAGLSGVHGLRWLGLYAVNWAMYALSFWILCVSLGHRGPVLPVASAFAAAYVLGYVMIFAPAGLGPREGFLIAFLTPHFGPAPSGVIAIVARLWTTAVELVPAGIFWSRYVSRTPVTTEEPGPLDSGSGGA